MFTMTFYLSVSFLVYKFEGHFYILQFSILSFLEIHDDMYTFCDDVLSTEILLATLMLTFSRSNIRIE